MEYTVYFYEAFEEEQTSLKKYLPSRIKAGFTWKTIQEAGHDQLPAAIISMRTQSIIPTNWAGNVDAFISRSTGYDHLSAYRKLTGTSAAMGHLPLYCNRAVAEQALLFWLALMRGFNNQQKNFSSFVRDGLTGLELTGKKIVVFGVGNIGHEIVDIARALRMDVFGVDFVKRFDDVTYLQPMDAAARADIIVASMNLTDQNKGYFNDAFWHQTKKAALFVNISRGELSPTTHLVKAIEDGCLSGIALDVFDAEKEVAAYLRDGIASDHPQVKALMALRKKDNVILTPHNAFNTHESVERKSEQSVRQLMAFWETGKLIWPI